jgi:hypothetical protein
MTISCRHSANKVCEAEQGYHSPRYAGNTISEVSAGTGGAKGGGRRLGCKTVPEAKAGPSAKKRIVPAIGALAALSSDGTEESSLHDRALVVQSKADHRGPLAEPQA